MGIWQTVEASVSAARVALAGLDTVDGMTVTVDDPDWVYGGLWVRVTCPECGACTVTRATDSTQVKWAAACVSRYQCKH